MIYDCFSFFNELDLLEIRLNVLSEVVDKFVLVEATKTHTGNDKSLYYKENIARYSKFRNKIIHIIVDDFSHIDKMNDCRERAWMYENFQRNAIVKGLKDANADDTIIISDVDEIPNPKAIVKASQMRGIVRLPMNTYYYFLNYKNYSKPNWRLGPQVLKYETFCNRTIYKNFKFSEYVVEGVNLIPSATMVRFMKSKFLTKYYGWHFSYMGGVEYVKKKIQSIAHTEFNDGKATTNDWILKRIAKGEDLFNRGYKFFPDLLDSTFPAYIVKNQDKYSHLILKIEKSDIVKTLPARIFARVLGVFIKIKIMWCAYLYYPFAHKIRKLILLGE